jgi:hypothetical protein
MVTQISAMVGFSQRYSEIGPSITNLLSRVHKLTSRLSHTAKLVANLFSRDAPHVVGAKCEIHMVTAVAEIVQVGSKF